MSENLQSLRYRPYGEQIGTRVSGYSYNSEQYDAATGMLHLRARQYEPAQNRFSQKDKLKGNIWEPKTQGRYVFTWDDPVNYYDANGLNTMVCNDGGSGGLSSTQYQKKQTQASANQAKKQEKATQKQTTQSSASNSSPSQPVSYNSGSDAQAARAGMWQLQGMLDAPENQIEIAKAAMQQLSKSSKLSPGEQQVFADALAEFNAGDRTSLARLSEIYAAACGKASEIRAQEQAKANEGNAARDFFEWILGVGSAEANTYPLPVPWQVRLQDMMDNLKKRFEKPQASTGNSDVVVPYYPYEEIAKPDYADWSVRDPADFDLWQWIAFYVAGYIGSAPQPLYWKDYGKTPDQMMQDALAFRAWYEAEKQKKVHYWEKRDRERHLLEVLQILETHHRQHLHLHRSRVPRPSRMRRQQVDRRLTQHRNQRNHLRRMIKLKQSILMNWK